MPTRIGFTGHRNVMVHVTILLRLLMEYPDAIWVHGNCPTGFDRQVRDFCEQNDIVQEKHPPVMDPNGGENEWFEQFHRRNREIVDSGIEILIAAHDGRTIGGTVYTMNYARKKGVPIRIVKCHRIR